MVSYKVQAFLLAAGLMGFALLACSPVLVANSNEGEAASVEVVQVSEWYCDSCGELTTDKPQFRTFDDGASGECCEYCAAFFTLDKSDRDTLRNSWKN